MRASVSKKLRKECLGMPRMKHVNHGITGMYVNHYRNAKKLYKGSVKKAVKAAINLSIQNEAIGKYK